MSTEKSQVHIRFPFAILCLQMDEGRKRVLLIAAAILAARKLAQFDRVSRVPATICVIDDAVRWAEQIMKAIDERWPRTSNLNGKNL